jgi:HAD superfamily phosphoserine phosphatase-like hydrolase
MQCVSFFDLDHTLLKVNSSFQFGSYLYNNHQFSFLEMLRLIAAYGLHKVSFYSLSEVQKVIFNRLFNGHACQPIYDFAESFIDSHFQRMLYQPAIKQLKLAQELGHHTVLLSSSPDFLVELFAKRFSMDAWESTHYAIDQEQHFYGISSIFQGDDKARYVEETIRKFGVSKNQTFAYSDSYLDLPFLKSVGIPVGVNPDRMLRNWCKKTGCKII